MRTSCYNLQRCYRGFSLIELITVIVILGVLSVGLSGFLKFGSQIYVETSERDQLISSARFAIERLNRELRTALPNSVRINTSPLKQCIEYTPIVVTTAYLTIPVLPEIVANEITVVAFDDSEYHNGLIVAVYPLESDDVYSLTGKTSDLAALPITKSGNEWTITLASSINFAEHSPTQRLFFTESPVSYCVEDKALWRYQNYTYGTGNTPLGKGVLMAEDIQNTAPFRMNTATQLRNATVLTQFTFSKNFEEVIFSNEIQVPNVP